MIHKILNPIKRQVDTVILGGRKVAMRPMGMEAALEFAIVLLPHISKIEVYWPQIQDALNESSKDRPVLLKSIFSALSSDMRDSPGDITRGLSLLFGLPEKYIAEKVKPAEVLEALPVADRLNGLQDIYNSAKVLGLVKGAAE